MSGGAGAGGSAPAGGAASGNGGEVAGGGVGMGGAAMRETIHYYGRWNRVAERAITVNSGSQASAQFTGTGVTARFDVALNVAGSIPTIAWQVDQCTWQEAEIAASVELATGLTAGSHSVFMLARGLDENQNRWAPPLRSSITFTGFEVAGGALQPSPRPLRPKLEILGDSITEGVAIRASYNGKTGACWRSDARVAYPFQAAQLLGAELRQVGFGYLGILKSGNGGVPKANDSFNWFYQGVARDDWQADMVIINEGTNDSAQDGATFRDGYATYLTTIRAAYPDAKIIALRPFNGSQAAQIQAAVQARTSAGDARVFYVDTNGWLGSGDYTDGVHPNPDGSTKAATALSAAVMKIGLP